MSNFSFSKQQNQMDCGPTCLYMISRYYGRVFSMEKLRELTEIGKEGVSLLGISDAAEKIGFQTTALQIPYRDSSFIIKVKLQNGLLTNYKKQSILPII
ncbi:MAG: cysteine peptidase family C39 domain-containing protein [Sediminibacterium sp.]